MELRDGKEGLRVNMEKTKFVSGINLDLLKKSGKDPCVVCLTGEGSHSIFFGGCLCWLHNKCSGIKGPLRPDPDFRPARCLEMAQPIDGRIVKEVMVDDEKLENSPEFCHQGNMLSAGVVAIWLQVWCISTKCFPFSPSAACRF